MTTLELRELYGYEQAPRGAQDVKDVGIPLRSISVTYETSDGKKKRMVAYTFEPEGDLRPERVGRKPIPKETKDTLLAGQGPRCGLCQTTFDPSDLQVDHRIPYQIAGDEAGGDLEAGDFMLADRSCQRSKSWACEHCPNWTRRDPRVCMSCFWANPDRYEHVATRPERRLVLSWSGDEVEAYGHLEGVARARGMSLADYLKSPAQGRRPPLRGDPPQ